MCSTRFAKILGLVKRAISNGESVCFISFTHALKDLVLTGFTNEEIRKILKALTALVLLQEGDIITNNKIIAKLDFLSAKAQYMGEINGEIAVSTDTQTIELIEARHPLIDPRKVVANSFILNEEEPIIIISGPNAGGKTVSLKTVGLLVLMHQSGLALPIRKGKLGYFKHIYFDVGDNQSLSDNLSTFSAHISQIGEIINAVGGKDLVLLQALIQKKVKL